MVWMPVHTSESQVGSAVKSDGTALTENDRDTNGLADRFAKAAAAGRRRREALTALIMKEACEVQTMAIWLARVTVQANSFRLEDGTAIRDSQADSAFQ